MVYCSLQHGLEDSGSEGAIAGLNAGEEAMGVPARLTHQKEAAELP